MIDELWYGNIQPAEETTPTAEMRDVSRYISQQTEKLREILSDDGKALLEKLADNFYCSIMLARNVPVNTVSKYMGHADPTITLKVYAHFIPDTVDTAMMILSELTADG